MTDPLCSAEVKCWEHYQPTLRVSERVLDLAEALMVLRALTHDIEGTRRACDFATSLEQRQWAEMVRTPFSFLKPDSTPKPSAAKPLPKTLNDVLDLL